MRANEELIIAAEVWRRARLVRSYLIEQCGQIVDDDRFASIYEWNHKVYEMQLAEERDE